MKRYKLIRDLPTFKAGDLFYIDGVGNLCAEDRQGTGFNKLVAYSEFTIKRFPNILSDWFVEIVPEKSPHNLDYDLYVLDPKNQDTTPEQMRDCIFDAIQTLNERTEECL